MMRSIFATSVLLLVCSVAVSVFATDETIVNTTAGTVRGYITEEAVIFRGIPYGAPPVRFTSPVPAPSWSGVKNVTVDPPGCPQTCELPPFTCPNVTSEDCLFLNVFTPRHATLNGPLPVGVFIHGGNFYQGFCGGPLYDGQFMVNTSEIVLVTVNYRLGALGYFVGAEGTGLNGNYGFQDQRLALKWVQANIANFGGDPNKVTIFGQSAGSISIISHMSSVKSAGLFHQAILESEPFTIPLKNVAEARKLGSKFTAAMNCTEKDVECFRSVPIESLLAAQNEAMGHIVDYLRILEVFLQWTPVVDGIELTRQPLDAIRTGQYNEMPVMIGTTRQEALLFLYKGFVKGLSDTEYGILVDGIFQLDEAKVKKLYPVDPTTNDQRPVASVLATNYVFACSTRNASMMLSNNNPTYHYVFDHALSFDGWGPNYTFCQNVSCHGVELPYLFHSASLAGFHYTPAEDAMSTSLVNYWTSFIKFGNPNTGGKESLYWPPFEGGTWPSLRFYTSPSNEIMPDFWGNICNFFDSIGYKL